MTQEERWLKESIENYIFAYTGKRAKISDADAQHFTACVKSYLNLCTPSLPSNLDEAAEEYGRKEYSHAIHFWDEGLSKNKPEVMKEDFVDSFKAGAEWMVGRSVSLSHLIAWYIQSVDASEPVWTEEHLEELVKDYILIPKN